MHPLLKKLNFKEEDKVVVYNAPAEFLPQIDEWKMETEVVEGSPSEPISFALGFAPMEKDLIALAEALCPKLDGDAKLWVAYPKKSSKKYKSDINRDSRSWSTIGDYKMEPVRQVALDEDWSVLRWRKVEFIKTLTRNKKMRFTKD
jgi:hypothetical protein